jgi:signal transduction histidine kinase
MELVGQFTGSIAQYFNNVLTLIIGYGSFLQTKLNEQDPLQPYVHQILASSERAALLTRSLLTFSRKQVISPRPVSVNEVIRRASKLIQRILGEGIEFKAKLSNIELPVSADPVQLEQVLMNLATNARDAMPDGGTLTVEAKLVEVGSGSQGYEKFDTGWRCAVISFSDTGVGIDKELKDRIFEPFFTTKEPGKGTGLGLSIVYGIIRRHNGSISVVSEPGKGSTFCIYLPVVRNGTTVRSRIEAPAVAAEASNCYS